jgi:DNA polymerase
MWAKYIAGDETDRQNSKPAVLGAGYGLGGGEMYKNEYGDMVRGGLWGYAKNVCGVDMPKDLAHKAVDIFRESYPEVVQFWTDLEEAFRQVLRRGGAISVGKVTWDKKNHKWIEHETCLGCIITFRRIKMDDGGYSIRMELPSGRALHYINATIEEEERISKRTGNPYTVQTLYYDGIEHSATTGADGQQAKKRHKWGRVKTYGGKICENAIQAIARDILLNGMFLADEMGFHIWGLFHDELATEEDDDMFAPGLDDLIWCMSEVPEWAPGLLLGAEGFEGQVYRKS